MPRGINAGRDCLARFHVDAFHLAVISDDGSSVTLADVELHAFGVVVLIRVAVDALPVALCRIRHVAVDEPFVIVLQAPLVDGQVLVGDVRRCDEAVGDIGVNAVGRDMDVEGLHPCPLVILAHEHLHRDKGVEAFHLLPLLFRGTDVALAIEPFFVADCDAGDECRAFLLDAKGKRGNVARDGYVLILRKDLRLLLTVVKRCGHLGLLARGEQPDNKCGNENAIQGRVFHSQLVFWLRRRK